MLFSEGWAERMLGTVKTDTEAGTYETSSWDGFSVRGGCRRPGYTRLEMNATGQIRCVEVNLGEELTIEVMVGALAAMNKILNRLELGWDMGEIRPEPPPILLVAYQHFARDADFDDALQHLRSLDGVLSAREVECSSAYDELLAEMKRPAADPTE